MKRSQVEEVLALLSNISRDLEALREMRAQDEKRRRATVFTAGPPEDAAPGRLVGQYRAMARERTSATGSNRLDLIRRKEEESEDLRAQSRADNRREAFGVLRRVERVARYKDNLAEAIGYLNDDDAELLAEFCATVLRITERDGDDPGAGGSYALNGH